MHIGIKLDIGFSENNDYRLLYGERNILGYLGGLGIETAETPVGPETSAASLIRHARQCAGQGFNVSLHPYTERTPTNPAAFSVEGSNACRSYFEWVFCAAREIADLQQIDTIVNIHPAAGTNGRSRGELMDKSLRFFAWAHEWALHNTPGVRPVAELQISPNRDENLIRIGDNYSELLELNMTCHVGACWDIGHAFLNSRRFGYPLDPPLEFLRHVIHVHCHDVSSHDHEPLIFGNVPIEHFFNLLKGAGFSGNIILEIPPQSFLAANGLKDLERSVGLLLRLLD